MRDPEPQSSARASGSPTSRTGSSALGHSLRFSALTLITWPSLRHLTAQRPGPVTDASSCDANRLPTVPFKSGRDLRPVKIQCAPTTNGRVGGQSSDDMRQSATRNAPAPLLPGTSVPVKRHRGEPGHTRDTRAHAGKRTGSKTPGGAGTHAQRTGAHEHTEDTDEPHNHPNPPTHPHNRTTAGAAISAVPQRNLPQRILCGAAHLRRVKSSQVKDS